MKLLTISVVILGAILFNVTSGFFVSSKKRKEGDGKIVDGTDAQRYDFPSLVSLQTSEGNHFCGGSILNAHWVLTAAHCLVGRTPAQSRVVAGLLIQKENHPDVQIKLVYQFVFHPNYPGGTQPAPNDIALVRLSGGFFWTYAVRPIAIPSLNQEFTGYAWTAGWGYLTSSVPVVSARLQRAQMFILSYQQCYNDFMSIVGSIGPLNQNMICGRGAFTGTESICKGDSGGPLLQGNYVIGVTSWTLDPCGYQNVPSVYTKISKYYYFIRNYVPGV